MSCAVRTCILLHSRCHICLQHAHIGAKHQACVSHMLKAKPSIAQHLLADVRRYDVTACATRVLPGKHGFVAQLNEGRANLKRPTEFRIDQVCTLGLQKGLLSQVSYYLNCLACYRRYLSKPAVQAREGGSIKLWVLPD